MDNNPRGYTWVKLGAPTTSTRNAAILSINVNLTLSAFTHFQSKKNSQIATLDQKSMN